MNNNRSNLTATLFWGLLLGVVTPGGCTQVPVAEDVMAEPARGRVQSPWLDIQQWIEESVPMPAAFDSEGIAVISDLGAEVDGGLGPILGDVRGPSVHCGVTAHRISSLVLPQLPVRLGLEVCEARTERKILERVSTELMPDACIIDFDFCQECGSARIVVTSPVKRAASEWTRLSQGDIPDSPRWVDADVTRLTSYYWSSEIDSLRPIRYISWNGPDSADAVWSFGLDLERHANLVGGRRADLPNSAPRQWALPIWVISVEFSLLD
jgi:hypothetical protein